MQTVQCIHGIYFEKSMIQTVVFQTKRWKDSLDKQHTDYNHMQIYKKTK